MDNTVGSLTEQQKQIVIGNLLGDGYMRIIEGRHDAFLEINHSIKAKEYVDWKYTNLKSICVSPPKERATNEGRIAYQFFTKQHKELTTLYTMFYKEGKKIIPHAMVLTPLILAVWFMDDGSKTRASDVYLNTQQFSLKDQEFLLHQLRALGLKARLNKDKHYYRIRFLKESIPQLMKIISPHIIKSMQYKLVSD